MRAGPLRWPLLLAVLFCAVGGNVALFLIGNNTLAPSIQPLFAASAGLRFRLDLSPASTGPNRLILTVHDDQERPAVGLRVQVRLTMRDMMGMKQQTTVHTARDRGAGRYEALGVFSMAGRWDIAIEATGPRL